MSNPPTPTAPQPAREPLSLEEQERQLLRDELEALLAALPDQRRAPYQALAEAVSDGQVPAEHLATLQTVLELLLSSGRARHAHRAEGERILQALYRRTPRGKSADEELAQTNRALRVLAGQRLNSIQVSSPIPGRYTLTIEAEAIQLSLIVDPDGVRVDKAAV
ncbi:MAG TPA: hypothetical protein VF184_12860 [Phycisphaeraceae bacterium]